jgi:hypothetical protein
MPCTVVNSLIGAVSAAAIGMRWLPAGLVTAAVCFGVIYLQGYLMPGTPELTSKLPEWVLELFGKGDAPRARSESSASEETTVSRTDDDHRTETEVLLRSSGVLEECDEADDLCLTDQFNEVWWRRIQRFRADEGRAAAQLAAVVGVDPAGLEFVHPDGKFGVRLDGDIIARWLSEAAFYADLAAEPTLSEWIPEWNELSDEQRTELLTGLRPFLDTCPACHSPLEQAADTQESCCGDDLTTLSVDCPDCEALVFSGTYQ